MSDGPREFDEWQWDHAMRNVLSDGLSDGEKERMIAILCLSNKRVKGEEEAACTEEEADALLGWANETRIMNGFLDALIDGQLYVTIKDGEPAFQLSPKGRQNAEKWAEEMGLPIPEDPPDA